MSGVRQGLCWQLEQEHRSEPVWPCWLWGECVWGVWGAMGAVECVSAASGCWEQQAGPGSEQGSRGAGQRVQDAGRAVGWQRGCASAPGSQECPKCLHLWVEEFSWQDVGDGEGSTMSRAG